MELVSANISSV